MNDKVNDVLITLFPTLIMRCSNFLNKSEIDKIFEILKINRMSNMKLLH